MYLEVTPSDDSELPSFATAVYCGTSGNLRVMGPSVDNIVTLRNLQAGKWHQLPEGIRRVMATGTNAADIVVRLAG